MSISQQYGSHSPGLPSALALCGSNSVRAGSQRQDRDAMSVPSPSLSYNAPMLGRAREPKRQGSGLEEKVQPWLVCSTSSSGQRGQHHYPLANVDKSSYSQVLQTQTSFSLALPAP